MLMLIQVAIFSLVSGAQILGVVNKKDGTASLIDVKTHATQTVTVGKLPHEIFLSADNAFVTNYGSAHIRSSDLNDEPGNTLSIISLARPYAVTKVDLGPARCAP